MCRLAGRHFFHFIAGSRPVNTPVPDGHFEHIRLFEKAVPLPDACAADSNLPQVAILKEKLLVAGTWGLQTLAVEPLDIVAFV